VIVSTLPVNIKKPTTTKEFFWNDAVTDPFIDTKTIPHDILPVVTSPLISKAVAKKITALTKVFKKNNSDSSGVQKLIIQWIDIIYAEHALLIRMVGTPEGLAKRKKPLELKNSALYEAIQLQINILQGPWLDVRNKIKLSE
jgi:hypothetical protein